MEILKVLFNFAASVPIYTYTTAKNSVESFKQGDVFHGITNGSTALVFGGATIFAGFMAVAGLKASTLGFAYLILNNMAASGLKIDELEKELQKKTTNIPAPKLKKG